jgi:hypothetical protein
VGSREASAHVERRVTVEVARILWLAQKELEKASKSEGGAAKLLTPALRRDAAASVTRAAVSIKHTLDRVNTVAMQNLLPSARDLTIAVKRLYTAMARRQHSAAFAKMKHGVKINIHITSHRHVTAALMALTNNAVATSQAASRTLSRTLFHITKANRLGKLEKKLEALQAQALSDGLNTAIVRAVQLGEAQAKQRDDRVTARLTTKRQALQEILSEKVERSVDRVFGTVEKERNAIAHNYLALKAFVSLTKDAIQKQSSSKRHAVLSLEDLLLSVASRSYDKADCEYLSVHCGDNKLNLKKELGVGMGAKTVRGIFNGRHLKVKGGAASLNGLVREYVELVAGVRSRWTQGLGAYVLRKAEQSMLGTGLLKLDKPNGHDSVVYIDATALGMKDQLDWLQAFKVPLTKFSVAQTKLAGRMSMGKAGVAALKHMVPPPEWQGN